MNVTEVTVVPETWPTPVTTTDVMLKTLQKHSNNSITMSLSAGVLVGVVLTVLRSPMASSSTAVIGFSVTTAVVVFVLSLVMK